MDFNERKKKSGMPRADTRNPLMGLNGVICKDPVYWCRMHEVWLSEEDVQKKKCLQKPSYNLMETRKCNCIERRTPPSI